MAEANARRKQVFASKNMIPHCHVCTVVMQNHRIFSNHVWPIYVKHAVCCLLNEAVIAWCWSRPVMSRLTVDHLH